MTINCQKQSVSTYLAWLPLFLICILCWHCEQEGVTVLEVKDTFSIEDQKEIGQTLREQILAMPEVFPILDRDDHTCAYQRIDILYRTLINTSDVENRRKFDWDIHIVDDPNKNAFMLPGGHLFIYSGLIKYLQTESELVAVIGHEIAYADQGHALEAIRAEYGAVATSSLCSDNTTDELPALVESLPTISYSEEMILEADAFSIALICPFQYDASSLQRVVEKAEQEQIEWIQYKGGSLTKRLDNINQLIPACGIDENTFEERYTNYKNKCLQ